MSLRTLKARRRENKTDYSARLSLLKSVNPRIVIRKSNKYIIAQVVESKSAVDKVVVGKSSKDLLKLGFSEKNQGSLKSIPASYLTGLLLAKTMKKGEFILDLGMVRKHNGGRIYACVKGLIDGGLKINANEKIFPSQERLEGQHLKPELKDMISKVKENIENGK